MNWTKSLLSIWTNRLPPTPIVRIIEIWDNFDTNQTVKVLVSCSVCSKEFGEMDATIEEVVDTPPTTTAGSGHYKAVITIDGQTLEDDDNHSHTFTIEPMGAKLEGHSISLDGDIAVNFYVKLSDKVAASENAYMQFEVPETSTEYQNQIVYVKDLTPVTVDGENYYVFKCRVAAKDMDMPILATLWDGDDSCMFDPYTVTDYAHYLLNNTDNPAYAKAQGLVNAMLAYGMHARAYFDSTEPAWPISNVTIPDYPEWVNADAEDIYDGMSISLKSQTTLSLFFKSEDELTLTCDNPQYETAHDGKNYVIRIRNIAAADLDKQINVEVNGRPAVAASPLTYCYKVQNSPDEKLANGTEKLPCKQKKRRLGAFFIRDAYAILSKQTDLRYCFLLFVYLTAKRADKARTSSAASIKTPVSPVCTVPFPPVVVAESPEAVFFCVAEVASVAAGAIVAEGAVVSSGRVVCGCVSGSPVSYVRPKPLA